MRTLFTVPLLCMLVTSACSGVEESASPESSAAELSTFPDNGTVVAKHSGKCLDVRGGVEATNDGARIEQWTCTGEANQAWSFKNVSPGQYQLVAKSSGKCIDLVGGGTANGTAIEQTTCSGSRTQRWRVKSVGDANAIVSVASGRCLTVAGGISATADGAYTELRDCAGQANQLWSSGGATPTPAPTAPDASAPAPAPAPDPAPSTQPFTPPALVNPVSPTQFGAKCDGVTDDSAAFQSAINASDVLVPAGRTCVINKVVSITMSNRHLECGTGTVLKQTVSAGRMFNVLSLTGGRLSGDSIVNCYFLGSNTYPPQADWNDSGKHYNIPVQTQDRVDNFYLAGNTFERFWGQSMFQTYGGVDGGSGDRIEYNTFKSCAYYGPVFAAHKNGYIGHNTLIDCAAGVENDDAGQVTGGNIIEYNTLSCVHGYGGYDMTACAMLTGGATENGADYSTNIVRNNMVSGVSDAAGFQGAGRPSRIIIGTNWGVKAAKYSNNSCTNGCVVTN